MSQLRFITSRPTFCTMWTNATCNFIIGSTKYTLLALKLCHQAAHICTPLRRSILSTKKNLPPARLAKKFKSGRTAPSRSMYRSGPLSTHILGSPQLRLDKGSGCLKCPNGLSTFWSRHSNAGFIRKSNPPRNGITIRKSNSGEKRSSDCDC